MTRDKKVALFIAPFLLIGGYIAADYYAQYQAAEEAKQKKTYELTLQEPCNVTNKPCLLTHDNLQLKLSGREGVTTLESSYPLDTVNFSYLDAAGEHRYQFSQVENRQQWSAAMTLADPPGQVSPLTLRLIVSINSAYYFSEFFTSPGVPDNGH